LNNFVVSGQILTRFSTLNSSKNRLHRRLIVDWHCAENSIQEIQEMLEKDFMVTADWEIFDG